MTETRNTPSRSPKMSQMSQMSQCHNVTGGGGSVTSVTKCDKSYASSRESDSDRGDLPLLDCHVGHSPPHNDDTPSEAHANHPKKVQFRIKFVLLGKYYYICGLIIMR